MSFIIMDVTVKRMNARNPLEEGLFLQNLKGTEEVWCKNYTEAKSFSTIQEAVENARKLIQEPGKPPKIFQVMQNGPNINITEYKY